MGYFPYSGSVHSHSTMVECYLELPVKDTQIVQQHMLVYSRYTIFMIVYISCAGIELIRKTNTLYHFR